MAKDEMRGPILGKRGLENYRRNSGVSEERTGRWRSGWGSYWKRWKNGGNATLTPTYIKNQKISKE